MEIQYYCIILHVIVNNVYNKCLSALSFKLLYQRFDLCVH